MADVIDALVVVLDLDATKFTQKQKQAVSDLRAGSEEARKVAQESESRTQRFAASLGQLKSQVLTTLGVFMGGRGLVNYVTQTMDAAAATSRLAEQMNMSAQEATVWDAALQRIGFAAGKGTALLHGMFQEAQRGLATGNIPQWANYIEGGIQGLHNAAEIPLKLADMLDRQGVGKNKAAGAAFLAGIGITDQDMINAILLGRKALQELRDASAETAKALDPETAKKFQSDIAGMSQALDTAGKAVLGHFAPAITKAANWITDLFVGVNKESPAESVNEWAANKVVEFLKSTWPGNAPGKGANGLPVKGGSGTASPAMDALARSITAQEPGLNRFTAFNDAFHAGTGSKHAQGLALDFTVKDPAQAAATAARIKARLDAMGVNSSVLDEYSRPSGRSTAPHIHVQINDPGAAAKYLSAAAGPYEGGAVRFSRESGALTATGNRTSNTETKIGNVTVVLPNVTDANGFANQLPQAMKRIGTASGAPDGLQ